MIINIFNLKEILANVPLPLVCKIAYCQGMIGMMKSENK